MQQQDGPDGLDVGRGRRVKVAVGVLAGGDGAGERLDARVVGREEGFGEGHCEGCLCCAGIVLCLLV